MAGFMKFMSKEKFPTYLADALAETENLLSETKETDSVRTELLFKCAWLQFHLGHVRKCEELLKQIHFPHFDTKEWIVENSLLICQLKGSQGLATMPSNILKRFDELLEKIQGLPQDSSVTECELLVAYNYSSVLFSVANDPASSCAPDGYHKSACILVKTVLRVTSSFNRQTEEQLSHMCTAQNVFTDEVCNRVLESINNLLEEIAGLTTAILSSVTLCCCLLAIVWMSTEQVDKARRLLHKILDFSQKSRETALPNSSTQVWDHLGALSVVTLVPPLPSPLCIYTLSDTNSFIGPGQNSLALLVKLLLAFCHYSSGEMTQALDLTESEDFRGQLLLHSLYIKGSILYEEDDTTGALSSFCQCLTLCREFSSNSGHTAVLNHMIGCCCARKQRPRTAITKFKEALECNMTQVSALYNISLQYRQLGDFDAEIQTLKFLLQAIHLKNTQDGSDNKPRPDLFLYTAKQKQTLTLCKGSLLRLVLSSALPDESLTVECVTWILANRCMELKRFCEAAEAFLDILTVLLEKPTALLRLGSRSLPNPSTIYCECASALLNAGRFDDTITICDKALDVLLPGTQGERLEQVTTLTRTPAKDAVSEDSPQQGKYHAKRSRQNDSQGSENDRPHEDIMLLIYKSDALIHSNQPVEALHCLNRVLKLLESVSSFDVTEITKPPESEEQHRRKKRKLLSGHAHSEAGFGESGTDCTHPRLKTLVTLKAQAYNNKGLILIGLDQPHDALQQLHQSLECWPGNIEAVFNHTLLLRKLGKTKESAYNWLTFRGLDPDTLRQGPVKQKLPEPSETVYSLLKDLLLFSMNFSNK